MTERQYKVVRVDRTGSSTDMLEEAEELAKVSAELVGVDCATEDEIIAAAKDADAILRQGSHRLIVVIHDTENVMQALPFLI